MISMEKLPRTIKVLAAEMMQGSVLISFQDGRLGLYSADLLYALLDQAHEIEDHDPDAGPA
jgi:hypothetical protein